MGVSVGLGELLVVGERIFIEVGKDSKSVG